MLTPTTVRLSDEHRDHLAALMAHYGARTDARMIRHLITMEYRRITGHAPHLPAPAPTNAPPQPSNTDEDDGWGFFDDDD